MSKNSTPPAERGFSLVELMVAVVIGLLGILVIMSVFLVHEGQKRTTTGGADANENALMSLVTIERDARIAGLGLGAGSTGLGCTSINAFNATLGGFFNFSALPITITQNSPTAGTDSITILHSTSPFGGIPTELTGAMASSADVLNVKNGDGFVAGDLILISQPGQPTCSLIQASANGAFAGSWTIDHLPGGPNARFNPPVATNIFPAGGYPIVARVTNMGSGAAASAANPNPMVRREYFVQNVSPPPAGSPCRSACLMVRDRNIPDTNVAPANPAAVIDGIIAIRAQYGRDTTVPPDGFADVYDNGAVTSTAQVVAVRVAIVSRSAQFEKTDVSPATLLLWAGGTVANGGAINLAALPDPLARRYRYKVYQTIIPLRNVIWTNNS